MEEPWTPTAHRTPTTVPRPSFWGRKFAGPKTSEQGDGSNPGYTAEMRDNHKRRHQVWLTLRGGGLSRLGWGALAGQTPRQGGWSSSTTDARRGKSHFWPRGGPEPGGDAATSRLPAGVGSVSRLHRHMGSRMARVPRGRALAPAASGGKAARGAEFPLDPWYRPSGSLLSPVVWGGRRPDCMAGEQPHAGGLPTPARSGGHRMAPGSGDNPRCWGGHTTDSLILECVHCSLTAHEGSALSS